MSDTSSHHPYESLGKQLQQFREKLRESLAEVSGAVEIDEDQLHRIEQGKSRPTEDILMLLINHFNIKEDEAVGLWEMAGYNYQADNDDDSSEDFFKQQTKQNPVLMVMALDQRIMYSDGAEISANKNGVVLHFTQHSGPQHVAIAKVGMSYEQAASVLEILSKTLAEADRLRKPRQLPPGPIEESDQ